MAERRVNGNITIEGAHILPGNFRNFAGNPDRFNPNGGVRSFCVSLDDGEVRYNGKPADIDQLAADGWNIKLLQPRDDHEAPKPFIRVRVKYGYRPPKIVQISGNKKVELDEESINHLDWADIETADVIINPYNYDSGKVTAYLQTLYVTIIEDEFASKYDYDER